MKKLKSYIKKQQENCQKKKKQRKQSEEKECTVLHFMYHLFSLKIVWARLYAGSFQELTISRS